MSKDDIREELMKDSVSLDNPNDFKDDKEKAEYLMKELNDTHHKIGQMVAEILNLLTEKQLIELVKILREKGYGYTRRNRKKQNNRK